MRHNNFLTIAIVGPLSGPRSAYGELLVNTVQDVISTYPKESVQYIFKDDEAQPDIAEKVAYTIIEEGVSVVIGHFNSACASRVKGLYEDAGIVFIMPVSTSDDLTQEASDLRFRLCASNTTQCSAVASRFVSPGTSAVVSDGTPYGDGLASVLVSSYGYQPITKNELLEKEQFDFNQVFIAGTHFSCAEMINHLNRHQFKGQLIGCDDCDIDEFDELLEKPYALHVMKLDKGFDFYIYNGLKSVLDIIHQEAHITAEVIARRLRQFETPFQFSENGDNQLSTWKCVVLEAACS